MLLNITPLVCYFDDFITIDECEHIISLAEPLIEPSSVCGISEDGSHAQSQYVDGRTSRHTFIKQDHDEIIKSICLKICKFANIHPGTTEPLQVVKYDVGQEYKPHWDSWDLEKERPWIGQSGQRSLTALLYLNDVEEGGYTIFPKLDIEIDPRPGRIVFFQNIWLGSPHRHDQSLHGGAPVMAGTKWIANLWFRERFWTPHVQ